MNKAEQRAFEAYPVIWSSDDEETRWDVMESHRMDFRLGYEQADKDLALTWEDMQRIVEIYYTLHYSYKGNSNIYNIYNEVLRRFNKVKEDKK